jgi:aspartyl-tRNA(Asn)/glutamyl-tRNA(Gln) amidotransferase subunit A
MSAPPVSATISELAAGYRGGVLSPVEVARACLDRIAAVDGQVRAFATVTADRALAVARTAEVALRDDPHGDRPLLGIPVAVKDLVDTAGVETAAGSAALAGRVPATSATVWRRLEAAGAVLVGKTRTHELAYGVWTPPTRNPWDTTRIPGGSSGGSAAALAAGMCAGAVGTDTAGSIRIPAGLCGVVGLKPTYGSCPTAGVWPLSPSLDHVGPMGRTVQDVRLLLDAMAGTVAGRRGGPAAGGAVALRGLRVGLANHAMLAAPQVAAALDGAVEALVRAGAEVRGVAFPSLRDALRHADHLIAVEAAEVNGRLALSAGTRLDPITRAKLEHGSTIDGRTYHRALRHARSVAREVRAAFVDDDVLLAPGVAVTAPRAGSETVTVGGEDLRLGRALCWNMAVCNLAGVPAVALPTGVAGDLPVGIQLIGPQGGDARLLAVAAALAERVDGVAAQVAHGLPA